MQIQVLSPLNNVSYQGVYQPEKLVIARKFGEAGKARELLPYLAPVTEIEFSFF